MIGLPSLVVADLLEQRLGGALGDAAVELALEEQRVDDRAGVVARDVADVAHPAGLGVDLDDGDVGAERERRRRRRRSGCRSSSASPSASAAAAARSAHVLETAGVPATWNAPRSRSSTMSASAASSAVAASCLALLDQLDGGLVDGRPALLQRARAHRPAADRHEVGVAPHELELVDRDAGLVAGDHRPRRVVALAVRRRAGVDDGPCRRRGPRSWRPRRSAARRR